MNLPIDSSTEHRRAERFSLELPTRIKPVQDSAAQEALEFVTSDICSGGAYFHTDTPLPVGTQVQIEMILPLHKLTQIEGKQTYIKVSGAVVRASEKGFSIPARRACFIAS